MTLSITWGGTALPLPAKDGIEVTEVIHGGHDRMITGTLRQQVIARKAKIKVKWHGLVITEWTTLHNTFLSKYNVASTLAITDGRSWSVLCVSGWPEGPFAYNRSEVAYYTVTLDFEEV